MSDRPVRRIIVMNDSWPTGPVHDPSAWLLTLARPNLRNKVKEDKVNDNTSFGGLLLYIN